MTDGLCGFFTGTECQLFRKGSLSQSISVGLVPDGITIGRLPRPLHKTISTFGAVRVAFGDPDCTEKQGERCYRLVAGQLFAPIGTSPTEAVTNFVSDQNTYAPGRCQSKDNLTLPARRLATLPVEGVVIG